MTEMASAAGHRLGEAAETARERAADAALGARRTARGVGARLVALPARVRKRARRGVEAVEAVGTRAVVSVLQAGTKALNVAAGYVSELAPLRRVERRAFEQFIIEQLGWAHAGSEAYDRSAAEADDTDVRMQLVRFRLEAIKQAETLAELLREIGGSLPAEERELPPPVVPRREDGRAHGPAALRQGLAHALTIAVQSSEGWRALARIGAWAEEDRVADAVMHAIEAVGSHPSEQVDFLRSELLESTVATVLA
jgi:hypothetical protein